MDIVCSFRHYFVEEEDQLRIICIMKSSELGAVDKSLHDRMVIVNIFQGFSPMLWDCWFISLILNKKNRNMKLPKHKIIGQNNTKTHNLIWP